MANAHRNLVSSLKCLLCLEPYAARASAAAASPPSGARKKNSAITSSPITQCSVCQKERSRASRPRRSSPRATGVCVVCQKERRRRANSVSTSSAAAAAEVSSSILRRPSKLLTIAWTLLGRLSSKSRVAVDDYVWALDSVVDVANIDPPLPVVRKPAASAAAGGRHSLWERRRGKGRLRELELR